MSWFMIELSREQVADGHIQRIQSALDEALLAAGDRPRVSMWAYNDMPPLEGNETRKRRYIRGAELYLSPGTERLIPEVFANYNPVPIDAPSKEDVALLVGRDSDWETLK